MNQLDIPEMKPSLTCLDIAQEQYETALAYLWKAKSVYEPAIKLLQDAMEKDVTVQQALAEVEQCKGLLERAKVDAERMAVSSWKNDLTDSKKEWTQDGYEIRVRETREPEVIKPHVFLDHLKELGVDGVVKSVRIILHKSNTMDLNDRTPLNGLQVGNRITCSITKGGITCSKL